jgi:hypothetical protein
LGSRRIWVEEWRGFGVVVVVVMTLLRRGPHRRKGRRGCRWRRSRSD